MKKTQCVTVFSLYPEKCEQIKGINVKLLLSCLWKNVFLRRTTAVFGKEALQQGLFAVK